MCPRRARTAFEACRGIIEVSRRRLPFTPYNRGEVRRLPLIIFPWMARLRAKAQERMI